MFVSQTILIVVTALAVYGLLSLLLDCIEWRKRAGKKFTAAGGLRLTLLVRNQQDMLERLVRALICLLSWHYRNIVTEIMIVDCDSDDDTLVVAQQLAGEYPLVRVQRFATNWLTTIERSDMDDELICVVPLYNQQQVKRLLPLIEHILQAFSSNIHSLAR